MFVPFLPLERGHVRQCAERELLQRGKDPKDHQHVIDKAADQVLVQCLTDPFRKFQIDQHLILKIGDVSILLVDAPQILKGWEALY